MAAHLWCDTLHVTPWIRDAVVPQISQSSIEDCIITHHSLAFLVPWVLVAQFVACGHLFFVAIMLCSCKLALSLQTVGHYTYGFQKKGATRYKIERGKKRRVPYVIENCTNFVRVFLSNTIASHPQHFHG